jgi:DNA-directed RNA polymerase specialized sigma24 family protein
MCPTNTDGPEWVLQADSTKGCTVAESVQLAARATWPFVQKRALKALSTRPWIHDHSTFVSEIWEGVLRATTVRIREDGVVVQDLKAYLVGAFNRRFAGALTKAQERRNVLEFVSLDGIEEFDPAVDEQWARNLQRDIEIKNIIGMMDDWTQKVWAYRRVGHSWRDIARVFGLDEEQARLRYTYSLDKIRAQVEQSKHPRKD